MDARPSKVPIINPQAVQRLRRYGFSARKEKRVFANPSDD
jgi:hypothetical protein